MSATWVDVKEYESARADVLANEMPIVLAKVNLEKQGELLLLCKHFLGLQDVEVVRVQTIDRLGMDLRIKSGTSTVLLSRFSPFPMDEMYVVLTL